MPVSLATCLSSLLPRLPVDRWMCVFLPFYFRIKNPLVALRPTCDANERFRGRCQGAPLRQSRERLWWSWGWWWQWEEEVGAEYQKDWRNAHNWRIYLVPRILPSKCNYKRRRFRAYSLCEWVSEWVYVSSLWWYCHWMCGMLSEETVAPVPLRADPMKLCSGNLQRKLCIQ